MVAYLAGKQAYREPRLYTRCTLARLVQGCDEVLRQLVNVPHGRVIYVESSSKTETANHSHQGGEA